MPARLQTRTPYGRGRPVPPPPAVNVLEALVGDSLTAISYGEIHPYYWSNAWLGGVGKVIANIGVSSEGVDNMLARIDNHYKAASPGLAGLPRLGVVKFRGGTNNTRGGNVINSTIQGLYTALFAKLLTYADRVQVYCVPPIGPAPGENPIGLDSYNTWLSAQCDADPSHMLFVDDCINVRETNGNWKTAYAPADGIHTTKRAAFQMGVDGAARLAASGWYSGYPSPLITDPADVYPAQPQWVVNPFNSGTGGTNLIGGGTVPSNWQVTGAGSAAANASIVAADAGDPNQTPWLRITPTSVSNAFALRPGLAHAAVTSGYPAGNIEIVGQIRFNALDASKFSQLDIWLYGSEANEEISVPIRLPMGIDPLTGTITVRGALERRAGGGSSSTVWMYFDLSGLVNYSGAVGTYDVRLWSLRTN